MSTEEQKEEMTNEEQQKKKRILDSVLSIARNIEADVHNFLHPTIPGAAGDASELRQRTSVAIDELVRLVKEIK